MAAAVVVLTVGPAHPIGAYNAVVSLGANLTTVEQEAMLSQFGVGSTSVHRLVVTNSEEHRVLDGIAPASAIGSRAISCAYVVLLAPQSGIQVVTHNITWVTAGMYRNALATAGVRDARVDVAAPFPVSGTAALVGILFGYHTATGRAVDYHTARVAAHELVVTGDIGHATSRTGTLVSLMAEVKNTVVADHLTTPEQIRPVVVRVAVDLGIHLTPAEEQQIVSVMMEIGQLHLNASSLDSQVSRYRRDANKLVAFWQAVQNAIRWILSHIFGGGHVSRGRAVDARHPHSLD